MLPGGVAGAFDAVVSFPISSFRLSLPPCPRRVKTVSSSYRVSYPVISRAIACRRHDPLAWDGALQEHVEELTALVKKASSFLSSAPEDPVHRWNGPT